MIKKPFLKKLTFVLRVLSAHSGYKEFQEVDDHAGFQEVDCCDKFQEAQVCDRFQDLIHNQTHL